MLLMNFCLICFTVWEVRFHPTSPNNLFTCSDDGTVLHWDATKGQSSTGAAFRNVGTPTGKYHYKSFAINSYIKDLFSFYWF